MKVSISFASVQRILLFFKKYLEASKKKAKRKKRMFSFCCQPTKNVVEIEGRRYKIRKQVGEGGISFK